MAEPPQLLLGTCPTYGCEVFVSAGRLGEEIGCPCCGNSVLVEGFTSFGVAQWEACSDAPLLRTCLRAIGFRFGERKLRLFACGVARSLLNWQEDYGFRLTVETGEALADGAVPAVPIELVRQALLPRRFIGDIPPQYGIALLCLEKPDEGWLFSSGRGIPVGLLLDLIRDLTPYPFVPLEWNPEWFTSTVRGLAAEIYEKRAFDLMPILGDALQDAGCDHPLVLDHCRTTKPHARGCWVVDAILGKT